jgi:hypothetical protein
MQNAHIDWDALLNAYEPPLKQKKSKHGSSQKKIYKHLLDALFEDVRSLVTTLNNACCMCTGIECNECNLCYFRDELEAICERAIERNKRLTD